MSPSSHKNSNRLKISSISLGSRVFITAACLLCMAGWSILLTAEATNPISGRSFSAETALFPALQCAFLLFVVVQICFFSAWLEGTTLFVRQVYGVRRWDLSSAVVTVKPFLETVTLKVRDPESGRRARLRVRKPTLRHAYALAGAITAGRPDDPEARAAADGLFQIAAREGWR